MLVNVKKGNAQKYTRRRPRKYIVRMYM